MDYKLLEEKCPILLNGDGDSTLHSSILTSEVFPLSLYPLSSICIDNYIHLSFGTGKSFIIFVTTYSTQHYARLSDIFQFWDSVGTR